MPVIDGSDDGVFFVEPPEFYVDPFEQFAKDMEGYCDWCEVEGHTFRTCPRRDDWSVEVPD